MVGLILRVVVSLALVLGLFWLAARAGSRRFSTGPRSLMRVRGRQSLSRTASLAVVEVGTRVLVVGVSDGGVRLLTELDPFELEQPESPVAVPDGVAPKAATTRQGFREEPVEEESA
jgi:flagellar protein FliO/FliZ